MKMLNEELEVQLKEVFEGLAGDVTIALFTKDEPCETCQETRTYMQEMAGLSDHIHLVEYNFEKDDDKVQEYGIEMVPSIVLLNGKGEYHGVMFNGIPAGHEINSFIPALLEVSGQESDIPKDLADRIAKIDTPVNIKVFVTLSCPHCPGAVQKAHKLALMNPNIHAEMIEAQTFAALSEKYNVSGVPKIVINEDHELLGNQPIQEFLNTIEQL